MNEEQEQIDRAAVLAANPLKEWLENEGVEFRKVGSEYIAKCPLHDDNNPSFCVNPDKNVWICRSHCGGGSLIDYLMKKNGITSLAALQMLGGEASKPLTTRKTMQEPLKRIVKLYDYTDEKGNLQFQAVRYEPKTFSQRRPNGSGGWINNLDGVTRYPYNLPAILTADSVWITEGEKDAETINSYGMVGSCNPCGAGKWLPEFNKWFKGKSVILLPDKDEKGEEHLQLLQKNLGPIAKAIRVVRMPDGYKDVTEMQEGEPETALDRLMDLALRAEVLYKGFSLPIKNMGELEAEYTKECLRSDEAQLDLSGWLPGFKNNVRPLVGGELVTILAATGVGKTMILQNIALNTRLKTLLFEVELPGSLTFERFAAMAIGSSGTHVSQTYKMGAAVKWRDTHKLDHIDCVNESRLTPEIIERIIRHAEFKTGKSPALVLLDYVQLIGAAGNTRYERASEVMEQLKIIAKSTNTIIVIASQVHRPPTKENKPDKREVSLADGKESGSIENSSGLVIGAWRDAEDSDRMWLRILKNTKGRSGLTLPCRIRDSLAIAQEAPDPR